MIKTRQINQTSSWGHLTYAPCRLLCDLSCMSPAASHFRSLALSLPPSVPPSPPLLPLSNIGKGRLGRRIERPSGREEREGGRGGGFTIGLSPALLRVLILIRGSK